MAQGGGDGPAASGGHRFLNEAYRAGVPRDWVLKLGSPVFREIQAEKEERKKAELAARRTIEIILRAFPALLSVVEERLDKRMSYLEIVADDQFQVLAREQMRRAEVLENEKSKL